MTRKIAPVLALLSVAVLLTGCAGTTPSEAAPTNGSTAPTSASPAPEVAAHLVVSIDGVSLVDGDTTTTAGFDDAAALLALLEDATGEAPDPTPLEDPPGYDMNLIAYDWDGVRVLMDESGTGYASIAVTSATMDGVPIATAEGLAVGSSRADLTAAQGWDQWDEDGDGIADYLGLGHQEVPGTVSLAHPGEVGIEFVLFQVTGDVVTQFQAPSNDYSDL